MTQGEFGKGWKLIVLQPWGARYRALTADGQPTEEAKTQLEFYYDKLKWGSAEAWMKTATRYAQGDKWPSLNDLRDSLTHDNRKCVRAIGGPKAESSDMPAEVRAMLAKIGRAMP